MTDSGKISGGVTQLFIPEPVLEKRLGKQHFEEVPACPGVYRFYDKQEKIIYVGKSKNLRNRLFSYKRARAGQVSQKVARMIGQISSFDYLTTCTEQEALLLENSLIRDQRPFFNHANKQPETYYFICIRPVKERVEFRLAMKMHEEIDAEYWYGCFKGHVSVRLACGCLLQL